MDPISMLKTLFPGRYEWTEPTNGSNAADNVLSASLFGPSVILSGALRSPEVLANRGTDPNVARQFGAFGTGDGSGSSSTSDLKKATNYGYSVIGEDDSHAVAGYGQAVHVGDRSVVEASGRANVEAGDNSTVLVSGSAGGFVTIGDASVAVGAEGNDFISGGTNAAVRGGDGDDMVMVGDGSVVTADKGDDRVYAGVKSIVDGGSGDDKIEAGVGSTLMGGSGNDTLSIKGPAADKPVDYTASTIVGGAGNDTIEITRAAVDMEYNRGDGDDIIKGDLGLSSLNLKDARYSDVSFSKVTTGAGNEDLIISFANSDDTITIKNANLAENGDFLMTFRGGAEATLSEVMAGL